VALRGSRARPGWGCEPALPQNPSGPRFPSCHASSVLFSAKAAWHRPTPGAPSCREPRGCSSRSVLPALGARLFILPPLSPVPLPTLAACHPPPAARAVRDKVGWEGTGTCSWGLCLGVTRAGGLGWLVRFPPLCLSLFLPNCSWNCRGASSGHLANGGFRWGGTEPGGLLQQSSVGAGWQSRCRSRRSAEPGLCQRGPAVGPGRAGRRGRLCSGWRGSRW